MPIDLIEQPLIVNQSDGVDKTVQSFQHLPMQKTTKAEFTQFQKDFLYWQNRFGLTDWAVYFHHIQFEGGYASIGRELESRRADVTLNLERGDGFTMDGLGLHECLHLLVADLSSLGGERFVTEEDISRAEESLVVRLEKVLGSEKEVVSSDKE